LVVLVALSAAALAGPAAASASNWTVEGEPLTEPAAVGFAGSVKLSISGSGIQCSLEGEASLFPTDEEAGEEGTGELTGFDLDPETCGTYGEEFGGCVVIDATTTRFWFPTDLETLPWSMQAFDHGQGSSRIALSGSAITLTFDEECKYDELEARQQPGGFFEATPDNPSAMSSWHLDAFLAGQGPFYNTTVAIDGEVELSPAAAYGIS
jgi:hypothetical protein